MTNIWQYLHLPELVELIQERRRDTVIVLIIVMTLESMWFIITKETFLALDFKNPAHIVTGAQILIVNLILVPLIILCGILLLLSFLKKEDSTGKRDKVEKKAVDIDKPSELCPDCKGVGKINCPYCQGGYRSPIITEKGSGRPNELERKEGEYYLSFFHVTVKNDGIKGLATLVIEIKDKYGCEEPIIMETKVQLPAYCDVPPFKYEQIKLGALKNLKETLGREPTPQDLKFDIKFINVGPKTECKSCGGSGSTICPTCKGKGSVVEVK